MCTARRSRVQVPRPARQAHVTHSTPLPPPRNPRLPSSRAAAWPSAVEESRTRPSASCALSGTFGGGSARQARRWWGHATSSRMRSGGTIQGRRSDPCPLINASRGELKIGRCRISTEISSPAICSRTRSTGTRWGGQTRR